MTAPSVIAVFARAPEPGKVKTRLAQVLGDESAKRLYVAMLRDTLHHAQAAAQLVGDCTVAVAFTPVEAFGDHSYSLAEYWSGTRHAQGSGDLGERMHHVFQDLFARGARKVAIIGSDMPTLNAQRLVQSLASLEFVIPSAAEESYLQPAKDSSAALGMTNTLPCENETAKNDLILGPTHDGGFYLIGANAPFSQQLFTNVQWSSHSTLQQVLANAQNLNLKVHLLPKGRDVDTIEDLRDLALRLRTDELPIADAPHTLEALRRKNLL